MNVQHFVYPLTSQWVFGFLIGFSYGASLVVQLVKNSPEMQETWVQSLSWQDPLEEGMATQPISDFLPGESHGLRSLVGYSPWGHKEWTHCVTKHSTAQHYEESCLYLYMSSCYLYMSFVYVHLQMYICTFVYVFLLFFNFFWLNT